MKLVLLFISFLYFASAQPSLEQIKEKIILTGFINSASIGPQLASFLPLSLGNTTTSIPVSNITVNITSNSLTILCTSKIWGDSFDVDFYFVLDSSNDIQLSFKFAVTGPVQGLYELITNGKPIPAALNNLKANATWGIWFASSAITPLPVQKGVTISGRTDIDSGDLLKLAHNFNPNAPSIEVDAVLYIPVFSVNPEYVTLTTKLIGDYKLSKTLDATELTFTVNVPTNIIVSLNLTSTFLNPSKQEETLQFTVSGEYNGPQDELILQGDMIGDWTHPFNIHWLTITQAEGKLTIQNATPDFGVTAVGDVTFSSTPVDIIISFQGPQFGDVLIEMSNIDVSKKLDGIYSDITGKSGPSLSQVNVAGKATVAISTYDGPTFQEGFTIVVDSTLTEGNLMKASRVLFSGATTSSFNYTATLYIPIFTSLAVDFSLVESTSFPMSAHMTCKDYSLVVDVSSDSEVTIKGDFVVVTKDGQDLQVTMVGDWQESSEEVTFTGNLNSPWVHPFKLNWLILETAQVQFALGGQMDVQLSFQGTATLAFDSHGPVNVIASIGGQDLTDALFSVSGLPLYGNTLDNICYYLLGMSVPPAIIKTLNPKGTGTVSIATYDSQYAQQGFTLQAVVNLQSSGELFRIAKHFSSDPTDINFNMKLYIDVFGSSPIFEFQLMENGAFNYEKNVVVNSYGLDVTVSENPSISVSADFSIQFKHQPAPINFDVSAVWQAGTSFTLNGAMTGELTHPFGCHWLNITSLSASITLSAPVGLQALTFSGACEFHFGTDTGTASISLDMENDFADTTLSMTVNNKWTLEEMALTMLGQEPASIVRNVESEAALSLSITISTASGISLDVNGQVTGGLQADVKKVAYWWKKDISNLTFDVSLTLPIFSADPLGISLSLDFVEEIQISRSIWFESVSFSIAAAPFSISLDTRVKTQFKKNPVLFFEVSGSFKESGEVLLWGAMEGTWENAFGIRGFNLSNVIIEFGLDPAMCAVDACISDIGLGLQMPLGSKIIKFDGNVASPDWMDIFLSGSIIDKKMDLDVLDVINDWNKINPTQPVATKLIPPTWGVYEVSFYFAPEDGTFGPIHYTAGFGVTGGIILLDMPLLLSLNCTDQAGFSCNFAFNVDISISEFTKMIKKELFILYPDRNATEFDIFSVKDARLSQWSQQNVAQGIHPMWNLDITVMNKPHVMNFRVEQYQLAGSFHDFFTQFLKHIF